MNVLIGVDGGSDSLEAVALAGRLLSPEADQILLYYSPPRIDLRKGLTASPDELAKMRQSITEGVFEAAKGRLPDDLRTKTKTIRGTQKPAHGLHVAAEEFHAEMIVIGARGSSSARRYGIGSVGRHVVHASHLPVLIARPRETKAAGLRVLLASDGSDGSRSAGKLMHEFNWPNGSIGRVMTVVESLVAGHIPEWLEAELRDNEAESGVAKFFERSDEQIQIAREDLLRHFGELPLLFQGQPPIVSEGHAASEILKAIESEKTDLVVMGARGLGPLGRFLIGSASEHVLTHAACSVLIVRQHEKP